MSVGEGPLQGIAWVLELEGGNTKHPRGESACYEVSNSNTEKK